jgi:hypothetical protein
VDDLAEQRMTERQHEGEPLLAAIDMADGERTGLSQRGRLSRTPATARK